MQGERRLRPQRLDDSHPASARRQVVATSGEGDPFRLLGRLLTRPLDHMPLDLAHHGSVLAASKSTSLRSIHRWFEHVEVIFEPAGVEPDELPLELLRTAVRELRDALTL